MTNVPGALTIASLGDRIRGQVLRPGDGGYEEARHGWNGLIDRRPACVVRCTDTADVIDAVDFARRSGLPLAVRSGGHDYAGNSVCDDGLVIDLSAMNDIRIDPDARRARVQPGATWSRFDRVAQASGLATTGGTVSTVGVAGFTLGGGSGWLARKYGLGLDNLVSADVVTASGELLHASEAENPDLFWAIRGGGGNFGVVTAFEFRLHALGPEVLAGQIVHPFAAAREALRFYREYMADAPDELQVYPFLVRVPPVEAFPAAFHGQVALFLVAAYAGDLDEGRRVLQPLAEFGSPILAGVGPQAYVDLQQSFDAGTPKGLRWYSKAHYLREMSDGVIDTVLRFTEAMPGPYTMVYFESQGGTIARVDPAATAFPHRTAPFGIHIFPGWADPALDEEAKDWATRFHRALEPDSTGGVYVNLLEPDAGRDRIQAAYGPNYSRLARLKKRYDPDNLFRMNHNVEPATG